MKVKIQKLIKEFIDEYGEKKLSGNNIFVKQNIKDIVELTNFLPDSTKINERLFCIHNNITEKDIKCPMCSKNKKFYTFTSGYNLTCSQSCSTKYQQKYLVNREDVTNKMLKTISEKSDEEKNKMVHKRLNTMKLKYGEKCLSKFGKIGYANAVKNGTYISGLNLIRETDNGRWKEIHSKITNILINDIDENGNNHYDRVHLKKLNDIDENGNNHYDRVHLKKLNDIDENGNNHYDRLYNTMVDRGHWTAPEDKDDFSHYYQKVWKLTRNQDIHLLENIEKRGHANKGMYHLDHMFSIFEGFRQNIPVYLIGNINNLKMIKGRNNISKGKKCSITLDELFILVREDYKLNYDKRSNDYPEREYTISK